tara:strand:- start:62698 stop:62982 length:285 start_codon:yes stop_codon:yes gene_type:complete
MKIKVHFSTDFMGNVIGSPVKDSYREQYAEHMQQFRPNDDGTVFFHEYEINELSGIIPRRKIRELQEGYSVTCLVDNEDYGHMLGYDAYLVKLK